MSEKILNPVKNFLNFAWKEDNIWSWIIFIGLALIFIKIIFFPILSLVTGTSLPLAIVESCSMYHENNFDSWWEIHESWYEEKEITKENFENFKLKNGFNKGDIFFIVGTKKENLEIGDVIIFNANGRPIIHRVVNLEPLQTKGDNNYGQLSIEENIMEEQIMGKATIVRVPYLGWVKLIFFEPFRSDQERGFCKER
jgi:signal peptidase I